ncbi:hypothetical protein [Streptomyces sporangiiformans]|uniref:Uncharacterized protein n=1 Tax=Streptomyces sporangiiformans TaxID=2315329 RepID=A0A505DP59_9ACTN|nr:hypothetical protein [Streptomyces sporangiiformans]TPQ22952.1 hypothetical protein FGD71_006560 [Streptomyces sporangiiformans]
MPAQRGPGLAGPRARARAEIQPATVERQSAPTPMARRYSAFHLRKHPVHEPTSAFSSQPSNALPQLAYSWD